MKLSQHIFMSCTLNVKKIHVAWKTWFCHLCVLYIYIYIYFVEHPITLNVWQGMFLLSDRYLTFYQLCSLVSSTCLLPLGLQWYTVWLLNKCTPMQDLHMDYYGWQLKGPKTKHKKIKIQEHRRFIYFQV